LVAVHSLGYDRETGRKVVRKRYLGSEDVYMYVSRVIVREVLEFKGLADFSKVLKYLDSILSYLASAGLGEAIRRDFGLKLIRFGEKLLGG